MKTIELSNIGPITKLSIPIPEGGGLVELRGHNGVGKTLALEAVDALITGNGKPPIRDNELSGGVSGLGATMTLGKSKRVRGELVVTSLQDRYDIGKLINGGNLKDAEAADAVRIKSLVHLAHVKPEPSLFYELVGGQAEFEKQIHPSDTVGDDLVVMAKRIKMRLEEKARDAEAKAQQAEGKAEACIKAAEGRDLTAESDGKVLQERLERAIAAKATIEAEATAAQNKIADAKIATEKLDKAKAAYQGMGLTYCTADYESAKAILQESSNAVVAAERALAEAKAQYNLADANTRTAAAVLKGAQEHESLTAQWSAQIDAAKGVEEVEDCAIEQRRAEVNAARKAAEQGTLIREAKKQLAEADRAKAEAAEHMRKADQLRDAARGTDDVLSKVVAASGIPIRIEPVDGGMRLTLPTARTDVTGRRTLFAELSNGERTIWAAKAAARSLSGLPAELRLFTLSQDVNEGLDPDNRAELGAVARECNVTILTARADDGDLTAEVLGE